MKFIIVVLGFVMYSTNALAAVSPSPTSQDFKEVDSSFSYKGKTINPHIIELFEGWESDPPVPIITTVDIAAAYNTNQFDDADVLYGTSSAKAVYGNLENQTTVSYKWIGRLKNGLHVVELKTAKEGRTLISTSLLLFRFSEGKGWQPNSAVGDETQLSSGAITEKPYTRLLMSIERYYVIGDRVDADYSINGNDITVKFINQNKHIVKTIHGEPLTQTR